MTAYEQLVKQIEESFKFSNYDAEEYAKKVFKIKPIILEEIQQEFKKNDK